MLFETFGYFHQTGWFWIICLSALFVLNAHLSALLHCSFLLEAIMFIDIVGKRFPGKYRQPTYLDKILSSWNAFNPGFPAKTSKVLIVAYSIMRRQPPPPTHYSTFNFVKDAFEKVESVFFSKNTLSPSNFLIFPNLKIFCFSAKNLTIKVEKKTFSRNTVILYAFYSEFGAFFRSWKHFFKKRTLSLYVFEKPYYSSCTRWQIRYNLVIDNFQIQNRAILRNRAIGR